MPQPTSPVEYRNLPAGSTVHVNVAPVGDQAAYSSVGFAYENAVLIVDGHNFNTGGPLVLKTKARANYQVLIETTFPAPQRTCVEIQAEARDKAGKRLRGPDLRARCGRDATTVAEWVYARTA